MFYLPFRFLFFYFFLFFLCGELGMAEKQEDKKLAGVCGELSESHSAMVEAHKKSTEKVMNLLDDLLSDVQKMKGSDASAVAKGLERTAKKCAEIGPQCANARKPYSNSVNRFGKNVEKSFQTDLDSLSFLLSRSGVSSNEKGKDSISSESDEDQEMSEESFETDQATLLQLIAHHYTLTGNHSLSDLLIEVLPASSRSSSSSSSSVSFSSSCWDEARYSFTKQSLIQLEEIHQNLLHGNAQPAISWCQKREKEILLLHSSFYFRLCKYRYLQILFPNWVKGEGELNGKTKTEDRDEDMAEIRQENSKKEKNTKTDGMVVDTTRVGNGQLKRKRGGSGGEKEETPPPPIKENGFSSPPPDKKWGKTPKHIQNALQFAQIHFRAFLSTHYASEVHHLMGCVAFASRSSNGANFSPSSAFPYSGLLDCDRKNLAQKFQETYREICGVPTSSPFRVCVDAGAQSIRPLMKLSSVIKARGKSGMGGLGATVPVELELEKQFRFHSVFTCPVSKEHSSPSNPPVLLRCGHVISQSSVEKLLRNSYNSRFKCPYCPSEQSSSRTRVIHF